MSEGHSHLLGSQSVSCHYSLQSLTYPPRLPRSAGFSFLGTWRQEIFGSACIFFTLYTTNSLYSPPPPQPKERHYVSGRALAVTNPLLNGWISVPGLHAVSRKFRFGLHHQRHVLNVFNQCSCLRVIDLNILTVSAKAFFHRDHWVAICSGNGASEATFAYVHA